MGKARKPDYNLSVLHRGTELKGNIGAAWIQEDGRITIQIPPCVVIKGGDPDLMIALFPRDYVAKPKTQTEEDDDF